MHTSVDDETEYYGVGHLLTLTSNRKLGPGYLRTNQNSFADLSTLLKHPELALRIPKLKFMAQLICFMIAACLYAAVALQFNPVCGHITQLDWTLLAFTFSFAVGEAIEAADWRKYISDSWNFVDILFIISISVTYTMRFFSHYHYGDDISKVPMALDSFYTLAVSVGSILILIRSFFIFQMIPSVGPLILSIQKMALDIMQFVLLVLLFLAGFYIALTFTLHDPYGGK